MTAAADAALDRLLTDRWLRVFIEAYLLARTPHAEIAERLDLPHALVTQYHDECYAVTPHLPYKNRIVGQFIQPHDAITDDEIVEATLKKLAYSGGTLVLDQARQTLSPMLPGPFAQALGKFSSDNTLADLKMRRIFATELAERDPFGARVMAYLRRQLPHRKPAATESAGEVAPQAAVPSSKYPPPPRRIGGAQAVA